MFTQQIKDIAQTIGQFYLKECDGDLVAATNKVLQVQINKLEVIDKYNLVIETNRPGLLIGKKGDNLTRLIEYIREKHPDIHKISIKETRNCLFNYLQPIDYEKERQEELAAYLEYNQYLQEESDNYYDNLEADAFTKD